MLDIYIFSNIKYFLKNYCLTNKFLINNLRLIFKTEKKDKLSLITNKVIPNYQIKTWQSKSEENKP